MNPIVKLIDNALKWSIRPTKDGAKLVYSAAAEADDYLNNAAAAYVALVADGKTFIVDLKTGQVQEYTEPIPLGLLMKEAKKESGAV